MTSDASKSPEQAPRVPADARPTLSSDDRLAADLRGFGPLGILAIVVIILAGALPFLPVNAILVLVWATVVAHAAFDLTALAMIYWNLESDVAHLVFK